MTVTTKISTQADAQWNNRLLKSPFGTVHQTVEYSEFRKKMLDNSVNYITFESNDKIVGQLVLLGFSRIKKKIDSKFGKLSFAKKLGDLVSTIKPMYLWYYGPIIFDNDYRSQVFEEIAQLPRKLKSPITGSLHPLDQPSQELKNKDWKEKKKGTFLVDLTLSEKELWKKIDRQSGRKAVNRALKKGIKVEQIKDLDDLKIHHRLLNEGREIAKLPKIPFERIEAHWNMLSNIGDVGFIAWLEERPLASTLVTTFNGYLNEQGFARSKFDFKNLMNGTDLIKWHIIKWGHEGGFQTFDLSGVEIDSADKKHEGIFKFKKKMGWLFKPKSGIAKATTS